MKRLNRLSCTLVAIIVISLAAYACKKTDPVVCPPCKCEHECVCKDDNTNKPDNQEPEDEPNVTREVDYEPVNQEQKKRFTYFNFQSGQWIDTLSEAYATQTDCWDIGICRTFIQTNSGTSTEIGCKGGAASTNILNDQIDLMTLPNDLDFWTDSIATLEIPLGNRDASRNGQLSQGYGFKPSIVGPTYDISTTLYVVRAANGKDYYAFKFISANANKKVFAYRKLKAPKANQ